jgi:hypothetical protein
MAAIITSKFRFHNAEQFKESFSEAVATNYYLFIGRPSEFATGTTGGTDSAPPTPVDNRRSEAYDWDDMLAAKKIDSTGVTHAIPRRDLDISGATTYDMYRPNYSSSNTATSTATNLFDSTFYFMTSAYRVYKVLDNGGVAWTAAAPTSTASSPFSVAQDAGSYSLKYMLTLSTTNVQNFLTPDFIPVSITPESGNALADGSLWNIKITTAGVAQNNSATWAIGSDRAITNVPIRGDGTGGLCTVTIGSGGSTNGTITTVAVTANGSGYTHANIIKADIQDQHDLQNLSPASVLTFPATDPVLEVIIGPDGGHGSNPAKELGGFFCLMDVKLQQTEAYDFSVVNDFRQLGIVRNPYSYATSSNFTGSTARQTSAIKLSSNSGTFTVDEKIYQTIAAVAISSITSSANGQVITVVTNAIHKLVTGQMVKVTAGAFAVVSGSAANGHEGTHHITVSNTTTFTYTITSTRAVAASATATLGSGAYTTFAPQAIVVEFDTTNNILFYVQNSYDNQGTDSTYKQNIPFSGNSTITGATSSATGVPDTSNSSTYNNTVFVSGYANPEMQPDSGDVIYVENRKPISRASDQTEDVKLVVEF